MSAANVGDLALALDESQALFLSERLGREQIRLEVIWRDWQDCRTMLCNVLRVS